MKVERLLQKNILVDFMPLEVICMSITISLLTLKAIYMRSVTIIKCYILILYTPMFNNILSNITVQITHKNCSTL